MKGLEYLGDSESRVMQLQDGTKERFVTQLQMARRGALRIGSGGVKPWGSIRWNSAELRVTYLKSSRSRLFYSDSYADVLYVLHVIVTRSAPEGKEHQKEDRTTIEQRGKALLQSRGDPRTNRGRSV
jgi:phage-related protein